MKHTLSDIQNRFNEILTQNLHLLNLCPNHEFVEVPMKILLALYGKVPRFCENCYAMSKINEDDVFSLVSRYLEANGFTLVMNHEKINLFFTEGRKIMVYYSYLDEVIGIIFYDESMDFITSIMDSFCDLFGKPKCSYTTCKKIVGDDFKVEKFASVPFDDFDTDTQDSKDNNDTATNYKGLIKSLIE